VPTTPDGEVAVIVVEFMTVTLVAGMDPKSTAVAPVKFVPVMVTVVPPSVGPPDGEIPLTVGGGSDRLKLVLFGVRVGGDGRVAVNVRPERAVELATDRL
jgi:hypothetical protein